MRVEVNPGCHGQHHEDQRPFDQRPESRRGTARSHTLQQAKELAIGWHPEHAKNGAVLQHVEARGGNYQQAHKHTVPAITLAIENRPDQHKKEGVGGDEGKVEIHLRCHLAPIVPRIMAGGPDNCRWVILIAAQQLHGQHRQMPQQFHRRKQWDGDVERHPHEEDH